MLNFSTAEIEYKYKFNVYTPSETHKLQTPLFKKKKIFPEDFVISIRQQRDTNDRFFPSKK